MKNDIALTPSMEDYLESILKMETINNTAKIKDIAKDLSVQMPSVIGALKTLRGKELVIYEKNSNIQLTKQGKIIAISVKERHEAIAFFLQHRHCVKYLISFQEKNCRDVQLVLVLL